MILKATSSVVFKAGQIDGSGGNEDAVRTQGESPLLWQRRLRVPPDEAGGQASKGAGPKPAREW